MLVFFTLLLSLVFYNLNIYFISLFFTSEKIFEKASGKIFEGASEGFERVYKEFVELSGGIYEEILKEVFRKIFEGAFGEIYKGVFRKIYIKTFGCVSGEVFNRVSRRD